MKPKMRVVEPEDWSLEVQKPPKPKVKKESPEFLVKKQIEEGKLQRTRDFGGLVPEPSEFLQDLCCKIGPLNHNGKS